MWFGRGLDQDWVDRANGFWSVLLLAACSIGSFLIRYITNPISCVCPAQFEDAQVRHALDTCFMKEVYHQSFREERARDTENPPVTISYHLWIPLILFMQALSFKIPNIIWTTCKRYLTFNLDETVESLRQAQLLNTQDRKHVFQDAARVLDSALKRNKVMLSLLYLVVKLLFLLNLFGQFVFITVFFRNSLLVKVGSYISLDSIANPLLPTIVFCHFEVRQFQVVHDFTLQCNLTVAEIYEKVYAFLWYWIFLLAVATFFNLLLWAAFLFIPFLRDSKISAYINANPRLNNLSITRFISTSLGFDGAFLMTMISQNSSEMVAANLSQEMYQVFMEKDQERSSSQPAPSTSGVAVVEPGPETVAMVNLRSNAANEEKPLLL